MLPKAVAVAMMALLSTKAEDKAPEFLPAKAHQELLLTDNIALQSANAPRSPREWAALNLTVIENETNGSLRIHEGYCRIAIGECDRGRARGPYQEQRNKRNAPIWDQLHGVQHTAVQVASGNEALRRSYWHWYRHCRDATPDWVAGTLTVFAGRSCLRPWAGTEKRLASYRKFVSVRGGA